MRRRARTTNLPFEEGCAEAGFDEFWAKYPRKVGKLAAQKKWAALRPTATVIAQMLDALAWQVASVDWQDPQFIPHPKTWLNEGRWMDERPNMRREIPAVHLASCPHEPKCGSAWECQGLKRRG